MLRRIYNKITPKNFLILFPSAPIATMEVGRVFLTFYHTDDVCMRGLSFLFSASVPSFPSTYF